VHWTQILHQIPDPAWKEVCTTIAGIDNKRRKKAAQSNATEDMDHALAMMFHTPVESYPKIEDPDETADLLLLADSDDDDLIDEHRVDLHAWTNEEFDE
jgi:hypothetical protein